jgi:hypothetical protein
MNHSTTGRLPRLRRLLARINGPWPQSRKPHRGDLTTPITAARPIHRLA